MERNYYNSFDKEHFDEELIAKVKKMGKLPSKAKMKDLADWVYKEFELDSPLNILNNMTTDGFGGGVYVNSVPSIKLYKDWNLVTFLHEIRHYIQYNSELKDYLTQDEKELDARNWSQSLAYSAFPLWVLTLIREKHPSVTYTK